MAAHVAVSAAWWTPEQVAAHYQMPVTTVRQRIRQKKIRAKNIGTEKRPIYRVSAGEIRRLDQQFDAA